MDRLLNWRVSCKLLNVSKPTLYKLTRYDGLKRIQISQRRVFWKYSDLLRFIDIKTR